MCLWSVLPCQECLLRYTPDPLADPIMCNNVLCERRHLDPLTLTPAQMDDYLDSDVPCQRSCNAASCGLVIRQRIYGEKAAFCLACYYDYDESSDNNSDERDGSCGYDD